jgi:hypothetical protein
MNYILYIEDHLFVECWDCKMNYILYIEDHLG